jgi:YgiT-type zinc finger domain-containing protein
MDMKVVTSLCHDRSLDFALDGECPHCDSKAVFQKVTEIYSEPSRDMVLRKVPSRHCAVLQCPGCHDYILAVVGRGPNSNSYYYEAHYPLGQPND